MFIKFINRVVIKKFFNIELSSQEKNIANESVKYKYSVALKKSLFYSTIFILPILFLDTNVIVSVLIPITMVSGTAWFAISLANMKQKFDRFGLELTINLFDSFSISLGLLLMLAIFSLASDYLNILLLNIAHPEIFKLISFVVGVYVIGLIVYKIFIGSIKYDINDSMLTGQNEAAEKFFRKSLSLLHSVSTSLKDNKSIQVANYYIGVAFFEIFSYMIEIGVDKVQMKKILLKPMN